MCSCAATPQLTIAPVEPDLPIAESDFGRVPDVEEMSLPHARELLKLAGLRSEGVDASAADRTVEHPEQWAVISQMPAAGTLIARDGEVILQVLRRGERSDEVLAMAGEEVDAMFTHDLALDYFGLTASEAEGLAASVDSKLRFVDLSGDRLDDSEVEDEWIVVGQDELPGSSAGGNMEVTLVSPSAPEVTKIPELHPLSWEGVAKYFGVVTGFETDDPGDHRVANVLIDNSPVPMVFIEPFDAMCEDGADASAAVSDRNKVLPIGTMVIATALTIGYWNEGGFIHPTAQIDPEDSVADSTNEQLVRLGSWIPDVPGVFSNEFDLTTTGSPTYFSNPAAIEDLTPIARSHLMRIIGAGNSAAGLQTGPIGGCVATAIERARLEAEAEAERKQVMDAWFVEYQRKVDSGFFQSTCRDGDGDGVCHEH